MNQPRPSNTYWAIPGELLAGEYPGDRDRGQARKKLSALMDCGITAFLDLTHAHELTPYEPWLAELARERGTECEYQRMPIRDVDVPRSEAEMRLILDRIARWRALKRRVYVHCWGGVGRTGTVIGCELVERGWSGEGALAQLRELWLGMSEEKRSRKPETPETEAQRRFVREWRARGDRTR